MDPVLLYDFDDITLKDPCIGDYIMVYAYNFRIKKAQEIVAIRRLAAELNCKTVCVNEMQYWCDLQISASPLDLLSYFRYAKAVVSDTFHGCILSIKYKRPFTAIVRASNDYSNQQKLIGLLDLFQLQDRIVNNPDDMTKIMAKEINYSSVDEKLFNKKQEALNYLYSYL